MQVMRQSSVGRELGLVAQNIAVPQVMQAGPDMVGLPRCQRSLFVFTSASTNVSAFAAAFDVLAAVRGRGTRAASPMSKELEHVRIEKVEQF
jgi:hypothetical protein